MNAEISEIVRMNAEISETTKPRHAEISETIRARVRFGVQIPELLSDLGNYKS